MTKPVVKKAEQPIQDRVVDGGERKVAFHDSDLTVASDGMQIDAGAVELRPSNHAQQQPGDVANIDGAKADQPPADVTVDHGTVDAADVDPHVEPSDSSW